MHSFLLIGQSNMAGRGFLADARQIDNSRIFVLRNGRWQKMFRPINPDRKFSGVSLAESFAEAYAKAHNVDVGLICCADGGTKLDQWMPGKLLFDNAVYQAKLAQRTSTIAGVLWHQGEGDCCSDLYSTYKPRFEIMMQAFRDQLDLHDVPFVVGGLGDFLALSLRPDYVHVNTALQSIAQANDLVGFVSAEGLTSNPDHLHFNAESLYEFGLRYFSVYESMHYSPTEENTSADTIRSDMELL